MIEFYGELSDKCKIDNAKRHTKKAGLVFLIATLFVAGVTIPIGVLRDVWIYSLVLIAFFVVFTIVAFIPSKRFLSYKIPSRLIVENDTISYLAIGAKNSLVSRPVSKVRKVIDMGDWYYIIFKFGDITNSWVCQKNLIIKGTIEDFEKLFDEKIIRKY